MIQNFCSHTKILRNETFNLTYLDWITCNNTYDDVSIFFPATAYTVDLYLSEFYLLERNFRLVGLIRLSDLWLLLRERRIISSEEGKRTPIVGSVCPLTSSDKWSSTVYKKSPAAFQYFFEPLCFFIFLSMYPSRSSGNFSTLCFSKPVQRSVGIAVDKKT